MDTLKSFLLVVLFLFAIVVGWLLITGITLQSSLLNVNYYTEEIDKHKLYELPKKDIILEVKKNYRDELPEPITTALSDALDQSFTPLWTETQVRCILTNFFDYLKGKNNSPDLTVNLIDRKKLLEKNLTIELGKIHPEEIKIYNIKTSYSLVLSKEIVNLANLPDQIDLSSLSCLKNVTVQNVITFTQKFYYYFIIFPYLMLLVIFGLMYRLINKHSSLKWLGNSMIVAGVLYLAAIFAFNGQMEQMLVNNIYYQVDPLQTTATDPLILATVFKNDLAIVTSIIAIIYCISGIGVTLVGYFLEKKENDIETSNF